MKTQQLLLYILCSLSISICSPISLVLAAPEIAKDGKSNQAHDDQLPLQIPDPLAVFSYQLEGRPDPFTPFISEKKGSNVNMDEIVDNEETLSGMQLFEPGQLKLVAIAFEENGELAMVEDAAGQGYPIRPGLKIGKKGVVTSIAPNQVVIEETSITRAGKKLTNNIVMQLKKEGDE